MCLKRNLLPQEKAFLKFWNLALKSHFLFSDHHPLLSLFVKAEDGMSKNGLVGKFTVYK